MNISEERKTITDDQENLQNSRNKINVMVEKLSNGSNRNLKKKRRSDKHEDVKFFEEEAERLDVK